MAAHPVPGDMLVRASRQVLFASGCYLALAAQALWVLKWSDLVLGSFTSAAALQDGGGRFPVQSLLFHVVGA